MTCWTLVHCFFLECCWLITVNVESTIYLSCEDHFPSLMVSGWWTSTEFCTHAHPLLRWSGRAALLALWRLIWMFTVCGRRHLSSLQSISVSCVLKKFWCPDSKTIILRVYQLSLYPFRGSLNIYNCLCIVTFPLQRNRSKICSVLYLFKYNLMIFYILT